MYTESYAWRYRCRVIRDNAIAWKVDLGKTLTQPWQGRLQGMESASWGLIVVLFPEIRGQSAERQMGTHVGLLYKKLLWAQGTPERSVGPLPVMGHRLGVKPSLSLG